MKKETVASPASFDHGLRLMESGFTFLVAALAQAISSAPPERIDLTVPQSCEVDSSESDEITVCARRNGQSRYRLNQPPADESRVPKAQVALGDGLIGSAETEQVNISGFPSNRLMLRLKIKF